MNRVLAVLMTALLGATMLFAKSQDTTTWKHINLDEVAVKAKHQITKTDCTVMLPDGQLRRVAANGRELMALLHLPNIQVSPITGQVGSTLGGELQMRINGVIATSADVAALSPDDILRVEYIPSPGVAYAASEEGKRLDAVVDIITHKRDAGGTVQADLTTFWGKRRAETLGNANWQHSFGRSAITVGSDLFYINRNNWIRDYDEQRISPTATVQRQEQGSPVGIRLMGYNPHVDYSLAESGKYLFNAKFTLSVEDTPKSEEADRLCEVIMGDKRQTIREHVAEKNYAPSLDLYYRRYLAEGQQLTFDVVGTYIRSKSHREYQEDASEYLTDIRGNKYSVIAEGNYQWQVGNHRFTAGLRHLQAYTNNRYVDEAEVTVNLHQSESTVFSEWQQTLGQWSYSGGVSLKRLFHSQQDISQSRLTVLPMATVQWQPREDMRLRYSVDLNTIAPSLAAMNNVEQTIAQGEVRRGNPLLKPFKRLTQQLAFSAGAADWLSASVSLAWQHEYKPIMEQVVWTDETLVHFSMNQRSLDKLSANANIIIRPLGKLLTLTLMPEVNRYISRMQNGTHTYTIPKFFWSIDAAWHNWTFSGLSQSGYANYLYGERLMKERDMQFFALGYQLNNVHVQLGVQDPFKKQYWMETRNLSPVLPSTSRSYTVKPTYVSLGVSIKMSYGHHQAHDDEQDIHNEDKDSGIMNSNR